MKHNPQLKLFLAPYEVNIQKLVFELSDFITGLVPETNELIWDNYNAVAIAYSKSEKLKDAFCHIAVYTNHVNFGFNRGAELIKNQVPLEGKGKLIRHLKVTDMNTFPKKEIQNLIWEAIALSEKRNSKLLDSTTKSKSIVMSISEKKLRPRKNV